MPKSAKKRKEKAADFAKAKLKLGKGKAPAANAVDTSFKARSIALPSQSITTDRDDAVPRTRRNLGINELLVHMKHYSPQVKRDALAGLRELMQENPDIVQGSVTSVLRACAQLVTDEDSTVRKALLSFFDWYFSIVPPDVLRPHVPTLLLFLTSAQTHIFPEIRIDGVRQLDALMRVLPDVVTSGWATKTESSASSASDGRRVLAGYLTLLNASGSREEAETKSSVSGVVLSPASRLLVLRSLASFLQHALEDSRQGSTASYAWIFASSFATRQAFEEFANILPSTYFVQRSTTFTAAASVDNSPDLNFVVGNAGTTAVWPLSHIVDGLDAATSAVSTSSTNSVDALSTRIDDLARALHSVLTSAFLDCAPTLLAVQGRATATSQQEIDTVVAVIEILRLLYVNIFRDPRILPETSRTASTNLQNVLAFMDPYFPFRAARQESESELAAERLNLAYCEMTGLMALTSLTSNGRQPTPRSRNGKQPTTRSRTLDLGLQVERVSEFIIDRLDLNITHRVSEDALQALLPTIWSLLNSATRPSTGSDAESRLLGEQVLASVVTHAIQCSSSGNVKPLITAFVGQVLLIQFESQYTGRFRLPPSGLTPELQRWVQELPKLCWQLGDSNLYLTETILTFLLRYAQRSEISSVVAPIRSRLCPYFTISHQSRGKLPGPYAKLQRSGATCRQGTGSLARLALDVANLYSRGSEAETIDLRNAVAWAVQSNQVPISTS